MTKILLLVALLTLVSGCASSLKVFDSQREINGIPISAPVLVQFTETVNYEVAPDYKDSKSGNESENSSGNSEPVQEVDYDSYCTAETNIRQKFMPLGERLYVNFEAAELGKSEFALTFFENGLLKQVSLNSDATSGVDAVSGFLSTVLPFVSTPKAVPDPDPAAAPSADVSPQDKKDKYCLKSGTEIEINGIVEVEKLDG